MNREEFIKATALFFNKALSASMKARKEGLLALEDDLDDTLLRERDIFEYGMRFVVDGTDHDTVDKILSNLIALYSDPLEALLKKIQREAVLSIQLGGNTRILLACMASYIGNSDLLEIEKLFNQPDCWDFNMLKLS